MQDKRLCKTMETMQDNMQENIEMYAREYRVWNKEERM